MTKSIINKIIGTLEVSVAKVAKVAKTVQVGTVFGFNKNNTYDKVRYYFTYITLYKIHRIRLLRIISLGSIYIAWAKEPNRAWLFAEGCSGNVVTFVTLRPTAKCLGPSAYVAYEALTSHQQDRLSVLQLNPHKPASNGNWEDAEKHCQYIFQTWDHFYLDTLKQPFDKYVYDMKFTQLNGKYHTIVHSEILRTEESYYSQLIRKISNIIGY